MMVKKESAMNPSITLGTGRTELRREMGTKTLLAFFGLTFALSWVPMAFYMIFPDQLVSLFGEISTSNPFFLLAVYAPSLAGIFLVWRYYGLKGLGSFFRRLALWRAPVGWWLYLLLGIPATVYAAAVIQGTANEPFPIPSLSMVLRALLLALMLGPVGEEFGWRGLALPLLQRRFSPFWASIVLGVIWAVWHTPAFLVGGTPQTGWSFGAFFVGLVAVTLILTPMFNAATGSLLIAILYHLQIMNPIFPDAQPWDSYLYVIAAAVILYLNRRQMFQRGSGVTGVLREGNTGS
jgi:membrane protease YdiL (CAAX protease family)